MNTLFSVAALFVLSVLSYFAFRLLNKLLKTTNWYRNNLHYTKQFDPFLKGLIEKESLDIVSLGSNPSLFAMFYFGVRGVNMSVGSQNQYMDFDILKQYSTYLKKGATILIPIMSFTAISTWLRNHPDYCGPHYYTRFARIIPNFSSKNPYKKEPEKRLKYPLWYNPFAIRYIIRDISPDTRYQVLNQPMNHLELQIDGKKWIEGWKHEFRLNKLTDVFDEYWEEYYNEGLSLSQQMVDYCLERGYQPVFICVPMTKYLSDLFPEDVRNFLVRDFVTKANVHNIPFLDYTLCEDFQDPELYFNSLFLNMTGRKLFTKRVLKDLNLIKP